MESKEIKLTKEELAQILVKLAPYFVAQIEEIEACLERASSENSKKFYEQLLEEYTELLKLSESLRTKLSHPPAVNLSTFKQDKKFAEIFAEEGENS